MRHAHTHATAAADLSPASRHYHGSYNINIVFESVTAWRPSAAARILHSPSTAPTPAATHRYHRRPKTPKRAPGNNERDHHVSNYSQQNVFGFLADTTAAGGYDGRMDVPGRTPAEEWRV